MLADIIIKYNKAKFEIINKFSNNNINVCEECLCIDKGYLKSKFDDFKKDYKLISNQIEALYNYGEKDDYNKAKLNNLIKEKNKLLLDISYLISNDKDNLELSKKLIVEMSTSFNNAIDGIISYFNKDFKKAKSLLENYYLQLNTLPNHYLINKIYGTILLIEGNYDLSAQVLRKAVEIMPNDLDLHIKLKNIYEIKSYDLGIKVEDEIISLLEVEDDSELNLDIKEKYNISEEIFKSKNKYEIINLFEVKND